MQEFNQRVKMNVKTLSAGHTLGVTSHLVFTGFSLLGFTTQANLSQCQ